MWVIACTAMGPFVSKETWRMMLERETEFLGALLQMPLGHATVSDWFQKAPRSS